MSVLQRDHQCPGLNWVEFVLKSPLIWSKVDVSSSVDHDCLSIMMASSTVMFGNSLLELIVLIYLWIILAWCLGFNDFRTPWFITEVVFGGKKIRSMAMSTQAHVGMQGNYWQMLLYDSELWNFGPAFPFNLWGSLNPFSFLFLPCAYMVRTSHSWIFSSFGVFNDR